MSSDIDEDCDSIYSSPKSKPTGTGSSSLFSIIHVESNLTMNRGLVKKLTLSDPPVHGEY